MSNVLDEILAKYDVVVPYRYYPVGKLYEIMLDLGLVKTNRDSFTRDWFTRKVRDGRLVLPEKKPFMKWQLTGEQIKEIVYAFAPGGEQRYDYREHQKDEQPSD